MRKTIRALTALTVGLLFATSVYAQNTITQAPGGGAITGSGNHSGNTVTKDITVTKTTTNNVHVFVVAHSFDGNSILSDNNVAVGGTVIGSGNSLSISH